MLQFTIVKIKPVSVLALASFAAVAVPPGTGLAAQQACLERVEPVEREIRGRASLRAQVIQAKSLCRQGKEKEAMKVLARVRNALKRPGQKGG